MFDRLWKGRRIERIWKGRKIDQLWKGRRIERIWQDHRRVVVAAGAVVVVEGNGLAGHRQAQPARAVVGRADDGDVQRPEATRYLRLAGLAPTGIHVLRHTAAKLRRDAGESIEDVSAFLDHSSLAVTTVYLRRLEGQEDRAWRDVAEAIGL